MSIREIQDQIQNWHNNDGQQVGNLRILEICQNLADKLAEVENTARHANNTASCLANGIQPD